MTIGPKYGIILSWCEKGRFKVIINIYSANGQLIRQLDLGRQQAGIHLNRDQAAYWDGKDEIGQPVSSGVYFYQMKAGNFNATRKMVIVK